jgi:tight adherence protein B
VSRGPAVASSAPDALARHVHRLAVLIGAGVAPASAWRHTARAARPPDAALDELVARIDDGAPLLPALATTASERGAAWRALAAAWGVAQSSGAPLAPTLTAFADALRDRAAAERDIATALAGPRATARIVMLLPLVAVLLALVMGVDPLAALAHPIALASVLVGGAFIVLARWWMARLLRAAAPPPSTVGLDLDLLAVAAAGGGAPEAALRLVRSQLETAQFASADERFGARADQGADALLELVDLSRRSGAPLGALARAEAREARSAARADAQRSAEVLAVRLMLPLGACVLPSFLLLGVVPMLVGLLSSTAVPR